MGLKVNEYWDNRPDPLQASPTASSSPADSSQRTSIWHDFDKHRLTLLSKGVHKEGQMKLRRYLNEVPMDVTQDTDIIEWWLVCVQLFPSYYCIDV